MRMKKLILAVVFCMLAATTFAQNNGLGIRVGSGVELQYERYFDSGNVLKVYPTGHVKTAIISDVFAVGAAKVIDGEERINQLITSDVIAQ